MPQIPFNPPQELIDAYFNRKQPAEIANEGIQAAMQTYVQQKALSQQHELVQQQKDIELAKGMSANGQDFMDALKQIQAARLPAKKPTASVPSSYPITPSAIPPADNSNLQPEANFQPASNGPALAVNPSGSPIINHFNTLMGAAPGGPTPPGGKPQNAPGLTNSPLTDPLVQEYQKDPIAFKKQHGEAGITKLKTQAETDKLLGEKGPVPYYDSTGNKQFELPPNGKLLPGSESKTNRTYIGNSEAGYSVYADKDGNQFSQGKPYTGKILTKNSETPTGTERSTAAYAKTIIPHINTLRKNIAEADKKGYIGPMAGRVYGEFLSGKIGSTGNADADRLLGTLRAEDSLMKSGAMKVHFGSRGGQQMYEHFSGLLNTGKQSAAMLNGALDGLNEYMQGYASLGVHSGGESGASPKAGDPLGIR